MFTGCAQSLHTQIEKNIHYGDSQERVVKTLGEPRGFYIKGKSEVVLNWLGKKDICELGFESNIMIEYACIDNPNYVNPARRTLHAIGLVLSGAGNGLANAPRTQTVNVNCTSTRNGDWVNTSCN